MQLVAQSREAEAQAAARADASDAKLAACQQLRAAEAARLAAVSTQVRQLPQTMDGANSVR